ncbi:MAG: SsrA-binding protein SmpB [Candidatus Eisenbacteria bacterium]|nr:SsrA-binding protein SmpB [Candidatus Eisenbacteria bacterium]
MSGDVKVLAKNKRARHDYHVVDSMEAGIVLRGTEVKSMRLGKVQLVDSYVRVEDGELFMYGVHISPYEFGNRFNVDPRRRRKLLVHRSEIGRLRRQVIEKGMTLVPLSAYLKRGRVKIEVGVCRGKKTYDKRQTLQERDAAREIERAVKRGGRDGGEDS